jgi:hypothetical protein
MPLAVASRYRALRLISRILKNTKGKKIDGAVRKKQPRRRYKRNTAAVFFLAPTSGDDGDDDDDVRFGDGPVLDRPHGRPREHGSENEVVPGRYDGHVVPIRVDRLEVRRGAPPGP